MLCVSGSIKQNIANSTNVHPWPHQLTLGLSPAGNVTYSSGVGWFAQGGLYLIGAQRARAGLGLALAVAVLAVGPGTARADDAATSSWSDANASSQPAESNLDFNGLSARTQDLAPAATASNGQVAVPLSRLGESPIGSDAAPAAADAKTSALGLGGPQAWGLVVIGVGLIGAAIRGFLVANRRLAKLRAEDPGSDSHPKPDEIPEDD